MRKIGPIIDLTALAEPALAADLATIDLSRRVLLQVVAHQRPSGLKIPFWMEGPAPPATEAGKRRWAARSCAMADLCQRHHRLRLDRNQLGSETIF